MATQQPLQQPSNSNSSLSSRRSSDRSLSLDLTSLPALTQPTPPSNTLLLTNLQDLAVFLPDNLQAIRDLVSQTAPIHAWSPLKSFRRIVVSFYDEASAIAVRQIWDGESVLGNTCRVYFGTPTPVYDASAPQPDRHLALPDAGKLFFISPPPSPPHDWEMKLEDPPNTLVHADDLAEALAKLRHGESSSAAVSTVTATTAAGADTPVSPIDGPDRQTRSRSSTLLYQPEANATSPGANASLPAICLEDMTDDSEPMSSLDGPESGKPIMAHTERPPVELMHDG